MTSELSRVKELLDVEGSRVTKNFLEALVHAEEEAIRLGHNYIGTEHLLLGITRDKDTPASKVLEKLGADVKKVRSALGFIMGRGDRPLTGDIRLTPRGSKVMDLTLEEALRLNHRHITTGHLLLGLVAEGEGIAAGILESFGVDLEKVRGEAVLFEEPGADLITTEPKTETNKTNPETPLAIALEKWAEFLNDPNVPQETKDQHALLLTILLRGAKSPAQE